MATVQKIQPNLWFNSNAEEAVDYYMKTFKNASVGNTSYYSSEGKEYHGKDAGTVLLIEFTLEGQEFLALNAGPEFKFNEAISFVINCNNQEEIDYYWSKLSADPKSEQCGWCKDKFGVSWQVTSTLLTDMMKDKDTDKVARMSKLMFEMKKIDIQALEDAFNGK